MKPTFRLKSLDQATLLRIRQLGVRHVCLLANCRLDADAPTAGWGMRNIDFDRATLMMVRERLARHDLQLSAVYLSKLDSAGLLLGEAGWQKELESVAAMVAAAGAAGVPRVEYSLLASAVVRCRGHEPTGYFKVGDGRGGAVRTHFDATLAVGGDDGSVISSEQMWERIERFVRHIVPVAEAHRVMLACHPDDPPTEMLWGQRHVLHRPAGLRRLLALHDSPWHGLLYCCGTMAEAGVDVAEGLRTFLRMGRVFDVDLRNVHGTVPCYQEDFINSGQLDVAGLVRLLAEHRYEGLISIDHVPTLAGDDDQWVGQAWSLGYLQALVDQAVMPTAETWKKD